MSMLLPEWPLLAAFFLASLALAVTPGPGVVYVITRTLAQGRRAGLASVAGVALGNLMNAIGASIGLAALFAVSSVAFTVVKYAGAAYLVYLGVRSLRARRSELAQAGFGVVRLQRIFRDGLVVAVFNPKTTIFFAAFLPQFMHPAASPILQSLMLGSIFVAIAAITDTIYVLAAATVAPRLTQMRGSGKLARYLTASAFIGLGVFTATSGGRAAK